MRISRQHSTPNRQDDIRNQFEDDKIVPNKHDDLYSMSSLRIQQLNCVEVNYCAHVMTARAIGGVIELVGEEQRIDV